MPLCRGRLVGVAVDDTRLHKTGRCIEKAAFYRDPLSPPFHVNLVRAIRFLQASLLVPFHTQAPVSTRALPIRFDDVPRVKKPSPKADAAVGEASSAIEALVTNPSTASELPMHQIPALVAELASEQAALSALQGVLTARLLASQENAATSAESTDHLLTAESNVVPGAGIEPARPLRDPGF